MPSMKNTGMTASPPISAPKTMGGRTSSDASTMIVSTDVSAR